jgi:hypothetical protein
VGVVCFAAVALKATPLRALLHMGGLLQPLPMAAGVAYGRAAGLVTSLGPQCS